MNSLASAVLSACPCAAAVSSLVNILRVTSRPSAFSPSYNSFTRSALSQPRSPVEIKTGHLMFRATLLKTGLERAFASDGATRSLRNARSFKSQIPPLQTAPVKRSSNAIPRATKEELHPSIREDCNSVLVEIVSSDDIIHDLWHCRFQIGTADDVL